jgi:hypothetical protein
MGRPSQPAKLSGSTNRRLNMYALAGTAAGVGALALAQVAEAKIVYTPTHKVIGLNGSYNLDLNHDGISDFTILERAFYSTVYNINFLSVKPLGSNGVAGQQRHYAEALKRGVRIGSNLGFYQRPTEMCDVRTGGREGSFGPWVNVTNRYLGLKFTIKGKTHYGWARLTVKTKDGDLNINAILTGYAYETIPNHSLRAGEIADGANDPTPNPASDISEPATLGLLALGWPGLSIWRREESAGAIPRGFLIDFAPPGRASRPSPH